MTATCSRLEALEALHRRKLESEDSKLVVFFDDGRIEKMHDWDVLELPESEKKKIFDITCRRNPFTAFTTRLALWDPAEDPAHPDLYEIDPPPEYRRRPKQKGKHE